MRPLQISVHPRLWRLVVFFLLTHQRCYEKATHVRTLLQMNIRAHESHRLCTRVTFAVPNPATDPRGHSPFPRLEDKVTELALGVCPGGCLNRAVHSLVCLEPELGDAAQRSTDPQGGGAGRGAVCNTSQARRRAAGRRDFIFPTVGFRA